MSIDRHGRSHKPKGLPQHEAGTYESTTGTDDSDLADTTEEDDDTLHVVNVTRDNGSTTYTYRQYGRTFTETRPDPYSLNLTDPDPDGTPPGMPPLRVTLNRIIRKHNLNPNEWGVDNLVHEKGYPPLITLHTYANGEERTLTEPVTITDDELLPDDFDLTMIDGQWVDTSRLQEQPAPASDDPWGAAVTDTDIDTMLTSQPADHNKPPAEQARAQAMTLPAYTGRAVDLNPFLDQVPIETDRENIQPIRLTQAKTTRRSRFTYIDKTNPWRIHTITLDTPTPLDPGGSILWDGTTWHVEQPGRKPQQQQRQPTHASAGDREDTRPRAGTRTDRDRTRNTTTATPDTGTRTTTTRPHATTQTDPHETRRARRRRRQAIISLILAIGRSASRTIRGLFK